VETTAPVGNRVGERAHRNRIFDPQKIARKINVFAFVLQSIQVRELADVVTDHDEERAVGVARLPRNCRDATVRPRGCCAVRSEGRFGGRRLPRERRAAARASG
jgi:hypothetical protein